MRTTRRPSNALRLPLLAASAFAAVLVAGGFGLCSHAAVYDDDQENYQINAPDTWLRGDAKPFEAHAVKLMLERRLKMLKGDVPAKGEGARMMLSVTDKLPKSLDQDYETWLSQWQIRSNELAKLRDHGLPAAELPKPMADHLELLEKLTQESRDKVEKALAGLGADKDVQKLMLARFDADPKKWPTPEIDEREQLGQIPAVSLEVKRVDCPNLEGNPQPCRARMIVCVLRKKMYRLVFWMWPQQYDPEHLKDESVDIQMNFQFIKTTAIPRRQEDKPVLPVSGAGTEPTGADAEEKIDREMAMSFEILKPKGWKRLPFDRSKPSEQYLGFRYDMSDASGAQISMDLYVYRLMGGLAGFQVDTYLLDLWPAFIISHPTGVLLTHPFPTYTPKASFLSLPNWDKKIVLKRPPPPGKDKKPDKPSKSELEHMGVLSQAEGNVVFGKEKARDCWRFCMFGQGGGGIGDEAALNYVFSTTERTYAIRLYIRKDAREKWGADLKRCLDSFKILEVK
jgi:hypothetical protein